MNRLTVILFIILMIIGGGLYIFNQGLNGEDKNLNKETNFMKITSPVFNNNDYIPAKYTCDGENISPPLAIAEVPEKTLSLVLIMDDPDAPTGTWVHWTIWNINPKTTEVKENSVPEASVQGVTSFGDKVYGGPCPPSNTHHYFFKLYALDTKLDLLSDSTKADLEQAMTGHVLSQTVLIGRYKR